MLVPGQIPASEFVDVASPPGLGAQLEFNGRRAIPPTAGDVVREGFFPDYPELMLALSRAFNPACDRILWEMSPTDRQQRSSAVFDFQAGHSPSPNEPRDELLEIPEWFSEVRRGTGLAVALGMVAARRNFKQEHWIVVVASAANVFQSLSHEQIEQLQGVESRLLIVVVDDGQALSDYDRVPSESVRIGQFDQLDSRWLSELGIPCREPVTGRSTLALLTEFQQIMQTLTPVVLHVRIPTPPNLRSELPTESHGRGVLRLFGNTGPDAAKAPSAGLDVVADELQILAGTDARVVAVVQDSLRSRFAFSYRQPDRSYLLPPAGKGAFTQSRGLALGGCRPFILVTGRYLQQSFNQLADQLCEPRQPVTMIIAPAPESPGADLDPASRPTSDLAYLRLLPGAVIAVPRSERQLRHLLRWSMSQPGPVAIQLPRWAIDTGIEDAGPELDRPIELGQAEILSEGLDLALLAVGSQVSLAMRAAELLSEQGVSVGVVDARFVAPLDRGLLRRLGGKVGGLVTLEEESPHGGFGAAVLEQLADDGISTPVIVSGQGAIAAHAGGGIDPDDVVREIVQQAVDLVDHAAGIGGFYGASPRRGGFDATTPVPRPDFSPAALEREKNLVAERILSAEVEEWFAIYSQVGERRRFLWQWCEQGAELTTLPSVPRELFQHVCQTKVLSIMLCVLLDDVADQRGRDRFLEVLLKIVDDQPTPDLAGLTEHEQYYVEITRQLADIYHDRVRGYPFHSAYADLLRYDQLQYFNTMRYSQLLNQNLWLLNPVEHDLYLPHAMDMMSFATIDLMCAADFSCRELGKLREALWFLQCMGRVGNLLCTWRREIGQQDFTSGVFARAIAQGDLTVEQLHTPDSGEIETAILKGGHEQYFLRRWRYYRECFLVAAETIESVDMLQLLEGNERFFRMHLASRGLI